MASVPDPTLVVPLRAVEVYAVWTKHLRTVVDALNFAAANAPHAALKNRYTEALADVSLLAGTESIAKYDTADHNKPSEVRHVSSSDSAVSGDGISSLKVDRGQPYEIP